MRLLLIVAAVTAAFLVVTCHSPTLPKGVTMVNNFDAKRYLGTWYTCLDHRFKRGLEQVTATYGLRNDDGFNSIKAIIRLRECSNKRKVRHKFKPHRSQGLFFRPILWRL